MDKTPNNIALWAMHRAGSTHFGQRLASSLAEIYGKYPEVSNLGEATGASGIVSTKLNGTGIWNELEGQLALGAEFITNHVRWEFDDDKKLICKEHVGSVNEEMHRRINLIKLSEWKNHLVLRNMRWPKMNHISVEYDRAFVAGDFHHVVLWRRDLFDWICSRYIFRVTGTPHGMNLQYDDVEYKFAEESMANEFMSKLRSYIFSFSDSLDFLPKERTLMVETTTINNVQQLNWLDQTTLKLIDPHSIQRGATVWKSKTTNQRVRPVDMITKETKEKFRQWADNLNEELDWTNLDYNTGLKLA